MQVEAVFPNKILSKDQEINDHFNSLFESTDSFSVKDMLQIGNDSVESLEVSYSNYNLTKDDSRTGEVKTNSIAIPEENINKLINSITTEDFNKYKELGIVPEKEDSGNILTVSERIKIELMTHCEDYRNTGTTVNIEDIKEYSVDSKTVYAIQNKLSENNLPITKDNIEQVESALDMAKEIKEINEGTEGYLLKNNMKPSINNIYVSMYSGADNVNNKNLSNEQWNNIKPQVEKLMQDVGIETNTQNLNNAKWIIEKNLPLTVDNLNLLEEIKNIDTGLSDEQLITQIVTTMSEGKNAKDTLLRIKDTVVDRVSNAIEVLNSTDDKKLNLIIQSGNQITVENLNKDYTGDINNQINIISAKKQLEEVRLKMTLEAGIQMLNKGIKIEVQPLKDLIKELDSIKEEYTKSIFADTEYIEDENDINQLQNVNEAIERLRSVPNYIIGAVIKQETAFTLQSTTLEGAYLKSRLDAASIVYETLGTTKRTDLGDSINKAFKSIDGLLEDIGLEDTESNNRAVRILAYNQMDITKENIITVKQISQEYLRLADNLKPRVTAHLIADKVNPLDTNINDLNDYIDKINEKIGVSKEEKYSEYLWKLEKDTGINIQEREAYIGIYRLLNMIQKDDFAAIGLLTRQGSEITLKTLASAIKTKKVENMDITVDSNFGDSIEEESSQSVNVLNQLSWFENRYYKQIAKTVLDKASPNKFKNISDMMDINQINIEVLQEEMNVKDYEEDKLINNSYTVQKVKALNEMNQISDEAVQILLDNNQKISPENIMAAANILKKEFFKSIKKELSVDDSYKIEDGIEDSETAAKTYEEFENKVVEAVEEKLETEHLQTLDLAGLKLIHSSVKLITNMSRKNYYHIPMEIGNEMCTIRLKVINNSEKPGRISIEMDSEQLGKISSELKLDSSGLKGIILCDNYETVDNIQKNINNLSDNLKEIGIETGKVDCCLNKSIRTGMWTKQSEIQKQPAKILYQTAKIFIKTLREWADDIN